jgi:hypothetical protein
MRPGEIEHDAKDAISGDRYHGNASVSFSLLGYYCVRFGVSVPSVVPAKRYSDLEQW